MQRRKFLVGMGSLAAGAAATMGTSALSSTQARRQITGQVVGDERAYLELNGFGTSENSFAVNTEDNQLQLVFDQDEDYDPYEGNTNIGNEEAMGLNPDAISTFDRVFRIQNDGTEPLDVHIVDNLSRVSWYGTVSDGGDDDEPGVDSIEGSGNAVTLHPFDENSQPSDNNDPVVSELDVGLQIDLRGITDTGDVFTSDNNFTVVADD